MQIKIRCQEMSKQMPIMISLFRLDILVIVLALFSISLALCWFTFLFYFIMQARLVVPGNQMVCIQTHLIAPNITRARVVSCTRRIAHRVWSTMRRLNSVTGQ